MYFVIALNNVEVIVVGEFNFPLSNYCNNLGNESNGGSGVGMHENLQVEDIVALVSFLTYSLQINGFQVFVEAVVYKRQHFARAFVDGTKCLSKKLPIVGKRY
jgi:hypothetical protein